MRDPGRVACVWADRLAGVLDAVQSVGGEAIPGDAFAPGFEEDRHLLG